MKRHTHDIINFTITTALFSNPIAGLISVTGSRFADRIDHRLNPYKNSDPLFFMYQVYHRRTHSFFVAALFAIIFLYFILCMHYLDDEFRRHFIDKILYTKSYLSFLQFDIFDKIFFLFVPDFIGLRFSFFFQDFIYSNMWLMAFYKNRELMDISYALILSGLLVMVFLNRPFFYIISSIMRKITRRHGITSLLLQGIIIVSIFSFLTGYIQNNFGYSLIEMTGYVHPLFAVLVFMFGYSLHVFTDAFTYIGVPIFFEIKDLKEKHKVYQSEKTISVYRWFQERNKL